MDDPRQNVGKTGSDAQLRRLPTWGAIQETFIR
jgi:hypothetical protein